MQEYILNKSIDEQFQHLAEDWGEYLINAMLKIEVLFIYNNRYRKKNPVDFELN